MAKKLYSIGIDNIKHFISINKAKISTSIYNNSKLEISKIFGRGYYDIAINDFFIYYKINKDLNYSIKVLNILKSFIFIEELYRMLNLSMLEDKAYVLKLSENSLKDYQKSIFFTFVYFLYTNTNDKKQDVAVKLFNHYFLHYVSTVNNITQTNINYKNLTQGWLKGKNFTIKESYKIDEITKNANFKILLDGESIVNLNGKSIKTLRKKAYKKAFLYLIDDLNETNNILQQKTIAYDLTQEMKTF